MIRRTLCVAGAVVLGVVLLAGRTDVTFVMKNGDRVSGTFSYNHTDHYQLIVGGKEVSYPSDDIAMIAFVAGDPPAGEVARLPESNDPPELERHTIVLRNGDMIRGKIYDFQGDQIIMDVRAGDRRTYSMGDTARLYISAPGARGVFKPVVQGRPGRTPGGQRGEVTVSVDSTRQWTDTGIMVNQGDSITFTASGEVRIDPRSPVGPDGSAAFARRNGDDRRIDR